MKKLLLIPALSLLASCAVMTPYFSEWSIDYSRYNKQGFFVSPLTEVEGEYTPIATVGTTYRYGSYSDAVSYSEILDKVVQSAIEKGANGLLGVKTRVYGDAQGWNYAEVEGVAVKFEGKLLPQNYSSAPKTTESINEESKYDFFKANASGRTLRIKKDGEPYYYDPETKKYISEEEFLKIYPEIDLLTIRKLKN